MLRSTITPNRTECNRVRHETRHNPTPLPGLAWRRPLAVSPDPADKKSRPNAFGVRLFKG